MRGRSSRSPAGVALTFAISAPVSDPGASSFEFKEQKTMYGGTQIDRGDAIYVFASENEGGLVAMGTVKSAGAVRRNPGAARNTPRVSILVRNAALAKRTL